MTLAAADGVTTLAATR